MGPDDPDIAKVTLPLLDRTMSYLFEQIEERGLKDILDTIITRCVCLGDNMCMMFLQVKGDQNNIFELMRVQLGNVRRVLFSSCKTFSSEGAAGEDYTK